MHQQTFGQHYLRLSIMTIVGGLVLSALGIVPTLRLASQGGVVSMLLGVATSTFAGLVGAAPVCLALAHDRLKVPQAILLGMTLRFLIVLAIVVSLTLGGWVDRVVFVVWVAISYLVLLAIETIASLTCLKSMGSATR